MTDLNYVAYKRDNNGNIVSYKNQPINGIIEISDDECDMLTDDEEIDVVGLEAGDVVVMQNPIDVQTDVIKPVSSIDVQTDVIKPVSSIDVQTDVIKPVSSEQQRYSHKILYGCTMCSKNFSTPKRLYIHLRSFIKAKDEDAFKCEFCQKVLCSLRRLKEHVLGTHYGYRYKCSLCTKKYVNLTSFETHKIVAHSKHLTKSSVSTQTESRSTSPDTLSTLSSQSPRSSMPVQEWIPNTNQSNIKEYSAKIESSCLRHPDIPHCICRLL